MAKRASPKAKAHLYISEWLTARGWDQQDLAVAIKVEPPTVSRYISTERRPDSQVIRAIEEALKLEPGQLFRPPSAASVDSLLTGLPEVAKREVLNFIAFVRTREKV